jgi:hypothetical protein
MASAATTPYNPQTIEQYRATWAQNPDGRNFNQWLSDHLAQTNDRNPDAMAYLGLNPNASSAEIQANAAAQAGAERAREGGNTNQVQTSNQSGQFQSQGTQQQTGTQVGQTSQQMNQVGTTDQTATTNQTTSTSGTSKMQDDLGFGKLLQDQGGMIAATDAERSGFLSDLVTTGGKGFQDQVAAATNQALSGPGMQGVGNAAQGRVAGSAVANVARNNMDQRLQASQQLAGPTGIQTASTAAIPYNTQTQSGTSSTTGTTQTTGTTTMQGTQTGQSFNLTDLVNNQQQSGTSTASGNQVATGQVPEGKSSSSGGCYVCTAYVHLGLMHPAAIRRGARYKISNPTKYGRSLVGYSVYGPWLARAVLRWHLFATLFFPFARAVLYEECRRATGVRLRKRLFATACHYVFHHGSDWVGRCAGWCGYKRVQTTDLGILALLNKYNLLFQV